MPEDDLPPDSLRIKYEGKRQDRYTIVCFQEGNPTPKPLGESEAIITPETGKVRICAQFTAPAIPFSSYWVEFTASGWRVGGKLLKPKESLYDHRTDLSYQAGGPPVLAKNLEVTDNEENIAALAQW